MQRLAGQVRPPLPGRSATFRRFYADGKDKFQTNKPSLPNNKRSDLENPDIVGRRLGRRDDDSFRVATPLDSLPQRRAPKNILSRNKMLAEHFGGEEAQEKRLLQQREQDELEKLKQEHKRRMDKRDTRGAAPQDPRGDPRRRFSGPPRRAMQDDDDDDGEETAPVPDLRPLSMIREEKEYLSKVDRMAFVAEYRTGRREVMDKLMDEIDEEAKREPMGPGPEVWSKPPPPTEHSAWAKDPVLREYFEIYREEAPAELAAAIKNGTVIDGLTPHLVDGKIPDNILKELVQAARPPPHDWLGFPELKEGQEHLFKPGGWEESDLRAYAKKTYSPLDHPHFAGAFSPIDKEDLDPLWDSPYPVSEDFHPNQHLPEVTEFDAPEDEGESDAYLSVSGLAKYMKKEEAPIDPYVPLRKGGKPPQPEDYPLYNQAMSVLKNYPTEKQMDENDPDTARLDKKFTRLLAFEEERLDMLYDQRDFEIPVKILSSDAMNDIYDRHVTDPVFYDVDRLSVETAIRPDKISLILQMVHRKKTVETQQNLHFNPTFHHLMKETFAKDIVWTLNEKSGDVYEPEPIRPPQTQFIMDDQYDEIKYARYMLDLQKAKEDEEMRRAHRTYFRANGTPDSNGYPKPIVFVKGNRSEKDIEREKKKFPPGTVNFNLYEINADPARDDFNREIVVTEIDGTKRMATWDERRVLLTKPTVETNNYKKHVKDVVGDMYSDAARERYFAVQKNIRKNYDEMIERHKKLPFGPGRLRTTIKEFYFGGAVPIYKKPYKGDTSVRRQDRPAPWWAISSPTMEDVQKPPRPQKNEE
ncbi:hypothetical protein PROFUN_08329 [Planoprotostelium fungivorum]|uniref:Uncharacterized protein n=1 Tax=Planoprotostelium fungivorum TaxID=1890364 RepID=A0A2P6NI15_9EUKA|nr:hypothetical protein PROFUN_08329 [Planoprotostelium fungivorum]